MEQEGYTYIVCTPEGLAILQRLHRSKINQRDRERNRHGKAKIRAVIRAVDIIRESGDVGISDEDLRASLDTEFDLTSQDMVSVMRVIRREIRPIAEAHRCPDETPKVS